MYQITFQILKSIRHPSIVRFIASYTAGGSTHLVVERSTPLSVVVDELTPLEICAGLHGLVDGLSFLHEKVQMYLSLHYIQSSNEYIE